MYDLCTVEIRYKNREFERIWQYEFYWIQKWISLDNEGQYIQRLLGIFYDCLSLFFGLFNFGERP